MSHFDGGAAAAAAATVAVAAAALLPESCCSCPESPCQAPPLKIDLVFENFFEYISKLVLRLNIMHALVKMFVVFKPTLMLSQSHATADVDATLPPFYTFS